MIDIDMRPKHKIAVPALGVFIAPQSVARLFFEHFNRCPNFDKERPTKKVLYPVARPRVYNCSRMFAVKRIPVSESTLRRDISTGKVSSEKDARGRRVIDSAELQRVYGQLKSTGNDAQSTEQGNGNQAMTGHDGSPKIVALLENQIQDLKAQLEKADAQLEIAMTEKTNYLIFCLRRKKKSAL